MKWTISKTYMFDAAHRIKDLPFGHKCGDLHGHTYRVTVHCGSDKLNDLGMVVDYHMLDEYAKPVIERLDHSSLNTFIRQPTAENIARWIFNQIEYSKPGIAFRVDVSETPSTLATYQP